MAGVELLRASARLESVGLQIRARGAIGDEHVAAGESIQYGGRACVAPCVSHGGHQWSTAPGVVSRSPDLWRSRTLATKSIGESLVEPRCQRRRSLFGRALILFVLSPFPRHEVVVRAAAAVERGDGVDALLKALVELLGGFSSFVLGLDLHRDLLPVHDTDSSHG